MAVLECSRRNGVATLLMSRTQVKNAFNGEMAMALLEALAQIRHDPEVRAVVLTGAGTDFCAGGDVSSMARMDGDAAAVRQRMELVNSVISALADLPCPVIAAVDGVAFGAGFSLALAADFILAAPRALLYGLRTYWGDSRHGRYLPSAAPRRPAKSPRTDLFGARNRCCASPGNGRCT